MHTLIMLNTVAYSHKQQIEFLKKLYQLIKAVVKLLDLGWSLI